MYLSHLLLVAQVPVIQQKLGNLEAHLSVIFLVPGRTGNPLHSNSQPVSLSKQVQFLLSVSIVLILNDFLKLLSLNSLYCII